MNEILHNKQAFILALLFAASPAGWAEVIAPVVLSIQTVDVDQDGNLKSIGWAGTLNISVAKGAMGYVGGAFDTVQGYTRDANNNWYVRRTINGASPTNVRLYGPPPNGIGLSANNVVGLVYTANGDYFTAYALTTGFFGGNGNGVNGPVYALALSSVGDLYVGGMFSKAGGFPYSSGIGVYGYEYGWNNAYIFSAFNSVHNLTWVSSTQLKVEGFPRNGLFEVNFMGRGLELTGNIAYWNTYNGQFGMRSYWSAPVSGTKPTETRRFEEGMAPALVSQR